MAIDAEGLDLADFRPGLRMIALRALGDPDAADDAAQETLVRALAALNQERLRDRARLAGFVHGILYRVVADAIRAKRRVAPLNPMDVPAAAPDALSALVSTEQTEALRAAVARLADDELHLLRLLYNEGLSSAEVAERLGEPPDRIRKRKSRLLERLRAFFQPPRHESAASATTHIRRKALRVSGEH